MENRRSVDLGDVSHIHILGICGTAMGAFAGMLQELGFTVTGSDSGVYPPMSTQLQARGIPICDGYRAENLDPRPDLVVVGNVIPRVNPEAQEMERLGLPFLSMPEALGRFFLTDKTSLIAAGTHGKTTTSSLLAWVLRHAGRDPSFMIGGQLHNFGKNAHLGQGAHFVIEGDEYDTAYFDKGPKFLHYQAKHAIITSVEFDHADIYRDLAHVQESFSRLLKIMPEDGSVIACTDYPALVELLPQTEARVVTYGLTGAPQWTGRITAVSDTQMTAEILHEGESAATVSCSLVGEHNLLNIIAVTALCLDIGLSADEIAAGMATFEGIKRRQEVVAEVGGVTIIDDFAHHPTAVAVTVASIRRRFAGRRLWAIFEPRSNSSRRNIFQDRYAQSFDGADKILIAEPKNVARIPEDERMDAHKVAADLSKAGHDAQAMAGADAIVALLRQEAAPGDVVLIMSNGGFDGIYQKLPAALKARPR